MAIPWAAFLAATRGLDFLKILTVGALPTRWQHQVPEIALVLWLLFYVASAVVARCAFCWLSSTVLAKIATICIYQADRPPLGIGLMHAACLVLCVAMRVLEPAMTYPVQSGSLTL